VQVTLEYSEKYRKTFPDDSENKILNSIEDEIIKFLKKTNTVHHIGHVTNIGYRDILFYIDKPNIDNKELINLLDKIQAIRHLNFSIDIDNDWNFVSAFI
jgi:hypothetical protein